MFSIDTVQTCLTNQIGVRREANPSFSSLYSSLTTSNSGLYLQDLHPLFWLDNLYSIAQDFTRYSFPAYSNSTTYALGDRVTNAGLLYESLANANLNNPVTDTTKWAYKDFFSEWIINIRNSSAIKMLQDVVTQKEIAETSKSILQNINLYDGWGNPNDKILKQGRFVYLEVTPKFGSSISINLSALEGQFDSNESFNLYIFHSSQYAPIYTIPVTLSSGYSMTRFELTNTVLNKYNGTYYIGYYEDDLTGQAIEYNNYYWGKYVGGTFAPGPCRCSAKNYSLYSKWSNYVSVRAGYVRSSDLNGTNLWNIDKGIINYNTTWGMNLLFSVECDISEFICTNKSLLSNALAKRLTVDLLQYIAYNTRNNGIAEKAQSKAFIALDKVNGDATKEYENSIKGLSFNMSALSDCQPCNKKTSITARAI